MKYIFKTNIQKKEFDNFVENNLSTSFMQTSSWANIKKAWEHDLIGMYKDEKLVCTALVLKRNLFLKKKLFYIPRGFVIDYKDKELLNYFVMELKKYAKKKWCN